MKSLGTTPATVEAFQQELGELLRALRFCAADGGFAVGRLLSVQVVPMGQPRQSAYRLQAILGPRDPKQAWLEGWLLSLSYDRGGEVVHTAALTNHRGEAHFPGAVPAVAECSLELRTGGLDATLRALQPFLEAEAMDGVREPEDRIVLSQITKVPPAREGRETPGSVPGLAPTPRSSRIEVPPQLAGSFVVDYRELVSAGSEVLQVRIGTHGSQSSPRWALMQGDTLVYPSNQQARGGEYSFHLPPGHYVLYAEERSVPRVRGGPVRTRGAARPRTKAARGAEIKGTRRQYRLTDLRLSAILQAESPNDSRLTVTSEDLGLANSAVVCAFGALARTLVRLTVPEGASWKGSVLLARPFSELGSCVPDFEIQPGARYDT